MGFNSAFKALIKILYLKANIFFLSYLTQFFLEKKKFQTNIVEEIKTYILNIFPSKFEPFMR